MTIFNILKYQIAAFAALLSLIFGGAAHAQLEGSERGVAPLASTGDFEVMGIEVETEGKNAAEARKKGWEEAQRKGWQMLYARTHGGQKSSLSDSALNNVVSAIIVEEEQIGPRRYVATLGVMFDRARAGSILGVGGRRLRSPPLLVLPIMWSGGSPQVFENRTEWQKAWARFRAGESPIDYVRPYGTDAESLMLTAGQAERRERQWWRVILDQFGAADVIIPIVRMDYEYPGGPVTGRFTARYGPDSKYLDSFILKVKSSEGIPAMMDQAIEKMDKIYASALSRGVLKTDKSLIIEDPFNLDEIEAELAAAEAAAASAGRSSDSANSERTGSDATASLNVSGGETTNLAVDGKPIIVSIQFDTPDVGAVGRGESSVRSVAGVSSASTSSLALGGMSVMRVSYKGDLSALASALRSKGWQVSQGGGALRISRGGGSRPATPPPAKPASKPAANDNGGDAGSDEPDQ